MHEDELSGHLSHAWEAHPQLERVFLLVQSTCGGFRVWGWRLNDDVDLTGLAAMEAGRKREHSRHVTIDGDRDVEEKAVEIAGSSRVESKLDHVGALTTTAQVNLFPLGKGSEVTDSRRAHVQGHTGTITGKGFTAAFGGRQRMFLMWGVEVEGKLEDAPGSLRTLHAP